MNTAYTKKKVVTISAIAFILGLCTYPLVTHVIPTAPSLSANAQDDGGLRLQTSDLTAHLLMGSDGKDFNENKTFKAQLAHYVQSQIEAGNADDISVYYRVLNKGTWAGVNENDHYAPASLFKVPLMIALFKEAESHPETLSQKILYTGAHNTNSGEYYAPATTLVAGQSYTVDELITAMIEHSDNNALDLLTTTVDTDSLNEVLTDLGVSMPEDTSSNDADYISTKVYSHFFRVLYNVTYLNQAYSEKALQLLTHTDFTHGISVGIPAGIPVANKFGERTTVTDDQVTSRELHDCGIIYTPGNPYLLCVMTKGTDFGKLSTIIGDVSRMAYAMTTKAP